MVQYACTGFYDAALNFLAKNTTKITVCATEPTTFAHASTTYMIAISSGLTTGEWTVADSTVATARKISSTQIAGIAVISSGIASWVTYINATTSKLLYKTICATKGLTTADTVTIPSHSVHILRPTSST